MKSTQEADAVEHSQQLQAGSQSPSYTPPPFNPTVSSPPGNGDSNVLQTTFTGNPMQLQCGEDGPVTHDVVAGETIYGLSIRYGVSIDAIVAANSALVNYRNGDPGFDEGDVITIPCPGEAPATDTPPPTETPIPTETPPTEEAATAEPTADVTQDTATGDFTTAEPEGEGSEGENVTTISRGVIQLISEGNFSGGAFDVRKPHFPNNVYLFEVIPADELEGFTGTRYNIQADGHYEESDTGTYRRLEQLSKYSVATYTTERPENQAIGIGPFVSGVTIGFGYDIGARWNTGQAANAQADFEAAGIDTATAQSLSTAVGLRGSAAGQKAAELRATITIDAAQATNLIGVIIDEYEANFTPGVVHPAIEEGMTYLNYWRGAGGARGQVQAIFEAASAETDTIAQFDAAIGAIEVYGTDRGYGHVASFWRNIRTRIENGETIEFVENASLDEMLEGDNATLDIVRESGGADLRGQLTGIPTGEDGEPVDGTIHVVTSGQTPRQIADLYGITEEELVAVNPVTIFSPTSQGYTVGQEIIIPNQTSGTDAGGE